MVEGDARLLENEKRDDAYVGISENESLHGLFQPSYCNLSDIVNDEKLLKHARQMYDKNVIKEKSKTKNGWVIYVKSKNIHKTSYKMQISWSDMYDEFWYSSFVYKCSCLYKSSICKHIGVALLEFCHWS